MRCKWFSRLSLFMVALLALGVPSAFAAVQNRISTPVSGGSHVVIPYSVHGKVRAAADLGPAAGDTKLENMTIRFSLSDAQQAALDQLLSDQQNPASPRYHQWLTPAQYGAQFGLSSADIAKVSAWLTSQGFTVDEVSASNTYVRFSGTVAQVDAAFATSIHNLQLDGNLRFANVMDISVPASLTGVVRGVTGLHNFKLKPRLHTRTVKFTSSLTGNHYIAPGDFYTIYNETPTLQSGISGQGVTIAIIGQVDISQADVNAFRTASGLAASTVTTKLYGTVDPGGGSSCSGGTNVNCPNPTLDDLEESSLDVEWAGAAAPGATILFVTSTDVMTSITELVNDQNLARTVSIASFSYGNCESSWGTSALNTYNQLFKQANAEGITVVGPSGDDGATDCDYTDTSAANGLAVDFPASSPYVTAMGGSMYGEGSATGGTSSWASTGNLLSIPALGISATYSALGYLPEAVWNEDTTGSYFYAGGGGASLFFSKPAWQMGTGVPNDASRDLPDLSLNAAASHDGYLYCAAGSCTSGFRDANGYLTTGGGTSFATPTFAGVLALVEQKTGSRIQNANQTIYALANTTSLYNNTTSSVFHDITAGNNNSPCTAGTPNCPGGGSIGYNAGTGFDLATGWGSINVYNLVNAWNTVSPLGVGGTGATVSNTVVTAGASSVAAGGTVTFTATVSGTSGTPTGTVQFLVNNSEVGAAVPLSGGTASYTYTTSCSNIGQLMVSASYSGDITYAGSKGAGITASGTNHTTPVEVTVTSGSCSDFSVSSGTSPKTVTSGTPSATITIASVNNFAGTVTLTASANNYPSAVPTIVLTPTSVTLTAGSSATTTLTLSNITAQLRGSGLRAPGGRHGTPWYAAGSGVTLAGLLFFITPRRRRLGTVLVALLAFGTIAGVTGCGGQTNGVVAAGANQYGTYAVTVTGTYVAGSGTVSHSTTVTFTVQ